MPRFAGTPVEEEKKKPRFGGTPMDASGTATFGGTEVEIPLGPKPSEKVEFLQDPEVDYQSGIPDFKFRAGFGAMSNERQRANYLDKYTGQGNWRLDSFGRIIVEPQGLKKLGIESDKPRAINESGMSRYDIADYAADIPALVGGIGGSTIARTARLLPRLGAAAGGAALGQGVTEAGKGAMGTGQTFGEVAQEIGGEAAAGALGEGLFGAARSVGKRLAAPGIHRMTPEREQMMRDALTAGFKPSPAQIRGGLVKRWEGTMRAMFGDFNEPANVAAASRELARLKQMAGPEVGAKVDVSEGIANEIIKGRRIFGEAATAKYELVDELVGGNPIARTSPLKSRAQEILDALPKTVDGNPVFTDAKTQKFLSDILQLPDHVTVSQLQQVRTILREKSSLKDLAPGLPTHHAQLLKNSAEESFDLTGKNANPNIRQAIEELRKADLFYKKGIRTFDNAILANITKDKNVAGAVDPDSVVEYIIRPGKPSRVHLVKQHISPEKWKLVERSFGEDMLSNAIKDSPDPFNAILSGQGLKDSLDKYGRQTVEAVMGKEWTTEAYKLANNMKLVSNFQKQAGGIVAAGLMLHPIKNLPKIAWMRAFGQFLTTPGGLKYMTTGILQGPKTKTGAEAINRVSSMMQAILDDETSQPLQAMGQGLNDFTSEVEQ